MSCHNEIFPSIQNNSLMSHFIGSRMQIKAIQLISFLLKIRRSATASGQIKTKFYHYNLGLLDCKAAFHHISCFKIWGINLIEFFSYKFYPFSITGY